RITMLCKGLMLSASLGLALVSTAPARADICFEYNSGGGVGYAVGAKVPAANTCERGTVVFSAYGAVATGSVCTSPGGFPTLVYQSSLSPCTPPYFESAPCHVELNIGTQDLPSQPTGSQRSSCSGVSTHMPPGQYAPMSGFSNADALKAWNCTFDPNALVGHF